ncbi:L-seryl-tRNA(Sec) kinase-like [Babylonia areolata]|uniref:L-seryl-tRNA(Sec) kinase-like n=1 Tax=Babylonia areolata TaxID=304850 RepID=UPI003FD3CDFD
MSRICLALLCGVPASGKSTLAAQIQDHVAQALPSHLCVLVLHYDKLIPAHLEQQLITQSCEQGDSLWKLMRIQITACVDHLLNVLTHGQKALTEFIRAMENDDDPSVSSPVTNSKLDYFVKPSSVDSALWERFVSLLRNSVEKTACCGHVSEGDLCSWLVVVDDNMHYSSMRYQYCQVARKYEAGLCIVHVACPLEEALQRNRSRAEDRVEDSVITAMHQRLEAPDSDKRPWEKYSASISGTSAADIQPLLEMVWEALMDPQRLPPEENTEEKVVSQYICSTSVIHQADQILRRCVSQHMAEAKGAGLSSTEMKRTSAELTKIRTSILNDMKHGKVTLPFQLDEKDVSNASKNTGSLLFQFVQALFRARIDVHCDCKVP